MSPVINKIVIMHFDGSGENFAAEIEDRPVRVCSTLVSPGKKGPPFHAAFNFCGFSTPAVGMV